MRSNHRYAGVGLALGLALAIYFGTVGLTDVVSGSAGMASDYQFTSSADGRSIYMWRVDGESIEFVANARARTGGSRAERDADGDGDDGDDGDGDDDGDDGDDEVDGKGRGQGKGKGKGKGGGDDM